MQKQKESILIFTPNKENSRVLLNLLEPHYDCYSQKRTETLLETLEEKRVDLVLLSYEMSEPSGLEVCKMIRKNKATQSLPVIFTSAEGTTGKSIHAFEAGASDFIVMPFHNEEFLLRIKARLRRRSGGIANDLLVSNLRLNLASCRVFVDRQEHFLTRKQFELLKFMVTRKNLLVTREECLEQVWRDTNVTLRNVDANISCLKNKLENFRAEFVTVPKQGYVLKIEN